MQLSLLYATILLVTIVGSLHAHKYYPTNSDSFTNYNPNQYELGTGGTYLPEYGLELTPQEQRKFYFWLRKMVSLVSSRQNSGGEYNNNRQGWSNGPTSSILQNPSSQGFQPSSLLDMSSRLPWQSQ